MKIGLDFDGVIINTPKKKAEVVQSLYGITIPFQLMKKERVVLMGLALEQYRKAQQVVYGTEVGLSAESMEGALLYLSRLQKHGHTNVIITARTGADLEIAKEWARIHSLHLRFFGVGYGVSKAQLAIEIGLDVYVDDDPQRLLELVGLVPHLFLFSWRYNEGFKEGEAIRRVVSWKELHGAIEALCKTRKL